MARRGMRILGLLAIPALVLAACGTTGSSLGTTTPVIATPQAGIPQSSPNPLGLTLTPNHGSTGSGVEIEGVAPPGDPASTTLTLTFERGNSDRTLGTTSDTKYQGQPWPSTWTVRPDPAGHFRTMVKVPRVLEPAGSTDLWLVEPGIHEIVLSAGDQTLASARFAVIAPPPTTAPTPTLTWQNIAFADVLHGWLIGMRCEYAPEPTPDANGNIATPPPPACTGVIEHSVDGGRSWTQQSLGDPRLIPQVVQFVDASHGWLVATTAADCDSGPCASVIFLTTDGGQHWHAAFHTGPNTPSLEVGGRYVAARSVALTTLAFTSSQDGWALGTACTSTNPSVCDPIRDNSACAAPGTGICQPVLYATRDGGNSWGQAALPSGFQVSRGVDLAHPTANDGWIISGGHIIATHDGGRTWQALRDPVGSEFWFEQQIYFRSPTQGWLLGGSEPGAGQQAKTLFDTTDGGRTWTEIAQAPFGSQAGGLPSSGYVGPILFTTDRQGWIVSPRAGLLHSADGGRTWHVVADIGYQDSLLALRFTDPAHGWLLGPRRLWSTSDGGQHWVPVALPTVATTDHSGLP